MDDRFRPRHLAIFFSPIGLRGRERLLLALARRLLADGHRVDLLTPSSAPWMREALPAGVRLIDLGRWWMGREGRRLRSKRRTYLSVLPLAGYLRTRRPDVLLAASIPPAITALLARRISRGRTPVVVRQSNTLHVPGDPEYGQVAPRPRDAQVRALYPEAQAVIAVSDGVADNLLRATEVPRESIRSVPNGVDLPVVKAAAREAPTHPWFDDGGPPVVVNVGRTVSKKDHRTLLRAFARLRARRPARLIIFGKDGGEQQALEALARELAIADSVDLAGFYTNPFAHVARADLFVLSSISEGMCNALIEALACGCPVVSTDCESGAREILDDGRYGPLVPIGDDASLAGAMARTLDAPLPRSELEARAAVFDVERAAAAYAEVLLGVAAGAALDDAGTDGLSASSVPDAAADDTAP